MAQRTERKHRRVRARSVTARVRAGDTEIAGEVENLSQSGLFVRTDELLFEGVKVLVSLSRAGDKRVLTLAGCVADMLEPDRAASLGRKTGMGISFDPFSEGVSAELDRLLRDLSGTSATAPAAAQDTELQRLRTQVRDLLIDLGDLKRSVSERDQVIEQQREELELLKNAIEDMKHK